MLRPDTVLTRDADCDTFTLITLIEKAEPQSSL